MKIVFSLFSVLGLALLGLSVAPSAEAQNIKAYVSAPGTSTDTYANAQIETFNSFPTGSFTSLSSASLAVGGTNATYTSTRTANSAPGVNSNDIFAASTTSGQYLSVTPGGTVTLTLAAAVPYVGLNIAALDNGNSVSFYDGTGTLINTFSAANITSLFSGPTVRAINGTTYSTSSYKGQPGNPAANDPNEYFAYVHFFGQNGTTIKTIVLSQGGGGNFETENHSILTTAPAVDGSFVVVPEPGVVATIAAGCLGLLALTRLARARKP